MSKIRIRLDGKSKKSIIEKAREAYPVEEKFIKRKKSKVEEVLFLLVLVFPFM